MAKVLRSIELTILYAIVFLIPVTVLPIFPNAYSTPKLALLTFGIAAILVLKVIRSLIKGSVSFHIGSFDIPLLALAATYIASLIIRTPNKMEGILLPGNATLIVGGVLLYFLISQLEEGQKQVVKLILIASGVLASVMSLLALSGIFKSIGSLPAFMQEASFSPMEGSVQSFVFFIALIPLIIHLFVSSKDAAVKTLMGTSIAVILFGVAISAFNLLPGRPTSTNMPSFKTSWEVAVDSIKENPLLGMGPGNYLTAFNRFRPADYNNTKLWAIRFTSGRNFYLTTMSETGLLGIFVIGLLFLSFYKIFRSIHKDKSLLATSQQGSLVVLLFLLAIFPAGVTVTILLFILLGFVAHTSKIHYEPKESDFVQKLPIYLVSLPTVLAVLAFGYYGTRILVGEAQYRTALAAVVNNDGRGAYDKLRSAIVTNPYVDRYRASYAQVNMALANNIAQKQELTDAERQTVSTLIQQAIREGKATVVLNPTRASNWDILANIYRSIIPLAKGADQFALQTARQAAILDPFNPNLRISLGGLHYAFKDYDGAVTHFTTAAQLKPDLANAYYNLALAYREKKDTDRAVLAMEQVVKILEANKDRNQKDYDLAVAELQKLRDSQPSTPTDGENLTAPEGIEEKLDPQLDLPDDANPPAAPEDTEDEVQASPSPSPVPTATPVASPTPGQ